MFPSFFTVPGSFLGTGTGEAEEVNSSNVVGTSYV